MVTLADGVTTTQIPLRGSITYAPGERLLARDRVRPRPPRRVPRHAFAGPAGLRRPRRRQRHADPDRRPLLRRLRLHGQEPGQPRLHGDEPRGQHVELRQRLHATAAPRALADHPGQPRAAVALEQRRRPVRAGRAGPHGRHQARRQAQLRRGHRPDGPLARRRRGHRLHRLHAQPHAASRASSASRSTPCWRSRRSTTRSAKMPYGTNYGVLLPACDGDVSTLQGARFFENAKYPTITTPTAVDNFAKVQWYVQGTNHNFFNTVWTQDDASTTTDPACSRQQPATTARLTPADQRRVGGALMNSFFRRYVGKETAFDPIMTGEVTLPASAAPLTSGKGLDRRGQDLLRRARRAALRRAAAEPDPGPAARPGHGRHRRRRSTRRSPPRPRAAARSPPAACRASSSATRTTSPGARARRTRRPTRCAPRARPTAPRATSSRSPGTRPAPTCAPSWAVPAPPSTSPSTASSTCARR